MRKTNGLRHVTGELKQLNWLRWAAVPDGTYFEPDEEYTYAFTVHVPNSLQLYDDELNLWVHLAVAKGDRLLLSDMEVHGPEQITAAAESETERRDSEEQRRSGKSVRSFPHRYDLSVWSVEPVGEIPRLTMGSQHLNVVRVLTQRFGGADTAFDSPQLTTCVTPADLSQWKDSSSPVRTDPLRVCPNLAQSSFDEYAKSMNEFYGLLGASSSERIALLPPEAPSAGVVDADVPIQAITLPPSESLTRMCAPVIGSIDQLLNDADRIKVVLTGTDETINELRSGKLSTAEATARALPPLDSAAEGATSFYTRLREFAQSSGPCGANFTGIDHDLPRNGPCKQAVGKAFEALTRAVAVAHAFTTQHGLLKDLSDGRLPVMEVLARSLRSLDATAEESKHMELARDEYRKLADTCVAPS
jgi:hypothetical protein